MEDRSIDLRHLEHCPDWVIASFANVNSVVSRHKHFKRSDSLSDPLRCDWVVIFVSVCKICRYSRMFAEFSL